MTNSIENIQIHVSKDMLRVDWNMKVHNHQYVWTNKELVVRLFCPSEIQLGAFNTIKSIDRFESSETTTQVGEVTGSVGVVSATSGVNKSKEIVRPVIQSYGLVREAPDDEDHYRVSFDIAKISPPISEGYEQYSIEWQITRIQHIQHFEIQVEFGYLAEGGFEKEYAHRHHTRLIIDEDDVLRPSLTRVLTIINNRLQATIFGLDKIFLEVQFNEESDAVIKSQLFKPYVVDIDASASTSEGILGSFVDAFEKYNHRVLLLGMAGAGKSTTLISLAKSLIEERIRNRLAKIPIYAPITNWRGEVPIRDWIVQETQMPSEVQQEINNNRAIFLLDGLDEIPSTIRQDSTFPNKSDDLPIKFLEKFREEFFGSDVVITCRSAVYNDLRSRSQKGIYLEGAVTIQPLSNEQIRWYLQKQPDLWDVVEKDNRLLELVRTPLLLRIFAVAFKGISDQARALALVQGGDGELRDEIFKTYVRQRCVHEAQKQPNKFPTQTKVIEWIKKIYDVLGKVAAAGQVNRKKHIVELLGNEAEDFVDQMCDLHILMRTDSEDVQFIHLLLEYHFAWDPLLDDLKQHHPGWSTVRRLGEIRDHRAVQPLIQALEYSWGSTSRDIARALGEIGDKEAVPALINLLSHRDLDTRKQAINALGLIADARAVVPLIELLDDASEPNSFPTELQRITVRALEKIGASAVEMLCASLRDERIRVRTEVARALSFIKDERAITPLINALSVSEERAEIPYPGFFVGYVDAVNTLLRVENKSAQFIHADRDICMYVFALSAIGSASIEPLIQLYQNSAGELQAAAMWALALIDNPGLLDFYVESLDSDQDKVRVYAVYGLARNCGLQMDKNGYLMPRSTKCDYPMWRLIYLINERPISFNLLNCTVWALGVTGQPFCVDAAIHYLRQFTNEHSRSKFHAIGGLGLSGDHRATSALIPFLQDLDSRVRVYTAEALGRLQDENAVNALLASLDDPDSDVRRHVIRALGEIGDKRAVKPILAKFLDDVHSVSEALAQLGDKSILFDLSSIAEQHEHQHIRKAASDLIYRLKLQSNDIQN